MSDFAEAATQEGPPRIPDYRYNKAMAQITLLRVMDEVDNKEVRRLISLLESPDRENWLVAEEVLKNSLSMDRVTA